MTVVVLLLILFVLIPAALGQFQYLGLAPRLKRWASERVFNVKGWSAIQYSAAIFYLITIVFLSFGMLAYFGFVFQASFVMALLASNCVAAMFFLYFYWGISAKWPNYKELVKCLVGPVVLVIGALSKIYSDSAIADLSGLAPQDLPGAQLWLTIIFTPVVWFLFASLGFGYLALVFMPLILIRNLVYEYRQSTQTGQVKDPARSMGMVAIMALFLAIMISLTLMKMIVSKKFYEVPLREAIAFSSFHHSAAYCGLADVEGMSIAPMSDDKAGIAISDKKLGYTFHLIECAPSIKNKEELSNMVRLLSEQSQNGTSNEN